jgi:hypothetical protein
MSDNNKVPIELVQDLISTEPEDEAYSSDFGSDNQSTTESK